MATDSSQAFADYQRLAEQSLDAWKSLWTHALEAGSGARPKPAFGAFGAPESGVERMLDGLKSYCSWLESMSAASAAAPEGLRWDQAFQKTFAGNLGEPFLESLRGMLGGAAGDPEQWMPAFLRLSAPLQQSLQGWLDLPAFGLSREHQEQSQRLAKAWLDYTEQSSRYQNLMARVGREAAERLQEKLADREAPGREVKTLRALYDLWIDAAEDVYQQVALSDEFREVYGAMVNAQMRVHSLLQQQVEQSSRQLGIPTRSEVNSLGQRLQELRRASGPAGLDDLHRELAALRAEVVALRTSQRSATRSDKHVTAKAATPRKTTRKPAAKSPTRTPRRK